jgi:hypothetical protein
MVIADLCIGAAVVTIFMLGGSSVGVCGFPAARASIMYAHSLGMCRGCSGYSELL